MKTSQRVAFTAALLLTTTVGFAQGMGQGRGAGQGMGGNYDPATETTVTGTVDEVRQVPGPGKGPGGLHLMLRTDAGVQEIDVGPAAFVSSKSITFAKGDSLSVTGSRITRAGGAAIIAREIKKGDQLLTLRDSKGFPLWSGAMRGCPGGPCQASPGCC
jgi:hypothetical protein